MEIGILETEASTDSALPAQSEAPATASTSGARSTHDDISSRPTRKRKIDEFENEETKGMTSSELHRYVLLRQLAVLQSQEENNKLKREIMLLKREKLQWEKEKRARGNESDMITYTQL